MEFSFFDRDISWLGFNHRVLMEAGNDTVPLLERIKFLSIFSSNLDEFYRVRIPALLSLKKLEQDKAYSSLLAEIERVVTLQMQDLGAILEGKIIPALRSNNIHLVYNEAIPSFLQNDCSEYFYNQVAGLLHPVILNETVNGLLIENNKLQLMVLLVNNLGEEEVAIVNIPDDSIPRFHFIDDGNSGNRYIIFLDDIIKENLHKIFNNHNVQGSFALKITRDAALELADEYEGDLADKIAKQLKKRSSGLATRFLYQPGIPLRTLYAVINKLNLTNANAIAGGHYHNLKKLASIPLLNKAGFSYGDWQPVHKKDFVSTTTIFDTITKKDRIIHTPYHSYFPVIRFFNEASLDNDVEEIYLTIYRVAQDSMIVNSLINAARNGKRVVVFVELKARFDEENNLAWAAKMKEAGIKIIYSIPGFKVHAKMALVKRREAGRLKYYGLLSTGNFNEGTARLYTDHVLLTAHPGIVSEMELLFIFFNFRVHPKKYQSLKFEHLLVAQFNLQTKFLQLIDREIALSTQGKKGAVTIKVNGLEDKILISKLYEASNGGVQIKLLVRGICCLIPGVPGMSENISVTRIVDRFLEHGRIFIFNNDDEPLVFSGSSDWMNKSMYRRIEVCYPVYDENIKKELMQLIEIQLGDNQKAVALDQQLNNIFIEPITDQPKIRSQESIYHLLKGL